MNNYPKNLNITEIPLATSLIPQPIPTEYALPITQVSSSPPSVTAIDAEETTGVDPILDEAQYLLPKKVTVRQYILKK